MVCTTKSCGLFFKIRITNIRNSPQIILYSKANIMQDCCLNKGHLSICHGYWMPYECRIFYGFWLSPCI